MSKKTITQFEIGWGHNFVYLLIDWGNGTQAPLAAIVDPQTDLKEPLEFLNEHGIALSAILLTHTHSDHTGGISELRKLFPKIPLYVHEKDAHRLGKFAYSPLQDEQIISIGELNIRALHTPGHSAGAVCFFLEISSQAYLVSGDTIFIGNCGRTDLETGSDEELFQSLAKIKQLPPDTIILPGHHYSPPSTSTLENECRTSPPFLCRTLEEFKKLP